MEWTLYGPRMDPKTLGSQALGAGPSASCWKQAFPVAAAVAVSCSLPSSALLGRHVGHVGH